MASTRNQQVAVCDLLLFVQSHAGPKWISQMNAWRRNITKQNKKIKKQFLPTFFFDQLRKSLYAQDENMHVQTSESFSIPKYLLANITSLATMSTNSAHLHVNALRTVTRAAAQAKRSTCTARSAPKKWTHTMPRRGKKTRLANVIYFPKGNIRLGL